MNKTAIEIHKAITPLSEWKPKGPQITSGVLFPATGSAVLSMMLGEIVDRLVAEQLDAAVQAALENERRRPPF